MYINTYIQIDGQKDIRVRIHTCMHTYIHNTYTHSGGRAIFHPDSNELCVYICIHIHTYIIHTHTVEEELYSILILIYRTPEALLQVCICICKPMYMYVCVCVCVCVCKSVYRYVCVVCVYMYIYVYIYIYICIYIYIYGNIF